MIKDVCFNDPGLLSQELRQRGLAVGKLFREEKTVRAAGRSRSLWFLKSILSLAFAPKRSPSLNWNNLGPLCSIRWPPLILVGAMHSPSTGLSGGTAANQGSSICI